MQLFPKYGVSTKSMCKFLWDATLGSGGPSIVDYFGRLDMPSLSWGSKGSYQLMNLRRRQGVIGRGQMPITRGSPPCGPTSSPTLPLLLSSGSSPPYFALMEASEVESVLYPLLGVLVDEVRGGERPCPSCERKM
jgi:hypothetical protein